MIRRAIYLQLLLTAQAAASDTTFTKTIGDVVNEVNSLGSFLTILLQVAYLSYPLLDESTPSLQQLRGSPQHRNLVKSNEEILKHMLKKDFFDEKDECLEMVNGVATYTKCDIRKFPYCHNDKPNICFNRINRQDKFWPDKNPYYYIDYNRVHCYPDRINNVDFSCSSCSPGRWCMPEGRCILDESNYHCWSDAIEED